MCGQDHDGMSHLSRVRQPGGIAPLEMLGDIRIIGFASCIFTWDLSTENPHWFSINADFHLQEGVRSDERTPEAPPPSDTTGTRIITENKVPVKSKMALDYSL